MRRVVPASAAEVFKNERRELSRGIMVKTTCLVEGTVRQFSERIPESPKRNRKFPYRKVGEIEAEIQNRELRIEELHHILADPATLRHGDKVKAAMSEIDAHRAKLRALYEHWEEAAEMN